MWPLLHETKGKSPIFQSKPLVYLFCCFCCTVDLNWICFSEVEPGLLDSNSWESFAKTEDAISVSSLHSSIIFLTRSIFSNRCAYQRELDGKQSPEGNCASKLFCIVSKSRKCWSPRSIVSSNKNLSARTIYQKPKPAFFKKPKITCLKFNETTVC